MFYLHQRLDPEFEELLSKAVSGSSLTRADGLFWLSDHIGVLAVLEVRASE